MLHFEIELGEKRSAKLRSKKDQLQNSETEVAGILRQLFDNGKLETANLNHSIELKESRVGRIGPGSKALHSYTSAAPIAKIKRVLNGRDSFKAAIDVPLETNWMGECAALILCDKKGLKPDHERKHFMMHVPAWEMTARQIADLLRRQMDFANSDIYLLPGINPLTRITVDIVFSAIAALGLDPEKKVQFVHFPKSSWFPGYWTEKYGPHSIISHEGKVSYISSKKG